MKFILSFILVFSTLFGNYAYSITPIDSEDFEHSNTFTECLLIQEYKQCLNGNWYLDYIGMQYIYDNNINLFPDFTVAILDSAVDASHEDIGFNQVRDISDEENNIFKYPIHNAYKSHGNMVTSLFSGGIIANGIGGRGIINADTLFLSAVSQSDLLDNNGVHVSIGYNAETVLEGMNRLLNPSQTSLNNGYKRPKILSMSVGVSPKTEIMTKGVNFNQGEHFKATQPIRDYIEQNSDVLFVLLAHNQSTDAKKSNGALHYKYIGNPYDEYEKLIESNYELNKLPNLIIVAANGPDNILHGYSNYGESVDISGPSGVYASGCVTDFTYDSLYYSIENSNYSYWYGYSYINVDYSLEPDHSNDSEDSPLFYELCTKNRPADGTSTSTPITAGVSGLLFSNYSQITPAEVKHYLVETPNLVKSNLRYNGNYNLTEVLAHQIPILNIEKSMKQYEAEHTIVEDFIGIVDRLKNSMYPIGIPYTIGLGFNASNFSGEMRFIKTNYFGPFTNNLSEFETNSLKWDYNSNTSLRPFYIVQNNCLSNCNYSLTFNYKTDRERYILLSDYRKDLAYITLPIGSGVKTVNFTASKSSVPINIDSRLLSNLEGKLYISNISLNGNNFDLSKLISPSSGFNNFVLNDISYSTYSFASIPISNYGYFNNESIVLSAPVYNKVLEITLPININRVKFPYTTKPAPSTNSSIFEVYDENDNQIYIDTNLPLNGVVKEANISIAGGTKKLKIYAKGTNIFIDKFEYTY